MWTEINRYRISDGDGNTEDLILERNSKGHFRLKNDFGNVNIEFDAMTGLEFVKRLFDDMKDEVEIDINKLFDDDLFDDSEEDTDLGNMSNTPGGDCNGQPD